MKKRGFSLVQLVIAAAVLSILLVTLLPQQQGSNDAQAVTQQNMQKIEEATVKMMAKWGRRPCPASGELGVADQAFGREDGSRGNCADGPLATGILSNGNLVGGVVPVKKLGLPNDTAFDGWGRPITYIVDKRATLASTCASAGNGVVEVKDTAAGSITDTVMAIYISHGKNAHGAFPMQGGAVTARINANSGDTDEQRNAAVDGSFAVSFVNGFVKKNTTQTFDDRLWYSEAYKYSCCVGTCPMADASPETD